MLDIAELNKKHLGRNVDVPTGDFQVQNENDKLLELQEKVEKILKDNQQLKKDVTNLSVKNQILKYYEHFIIYLDLGRHTTDGQNIQTRHHSLRSAWPVGVK